MARGVDAMANSLRALEIAEFPSMILQPVFDLHGAVVPILELLGAV